MLCIEDYAKLIAHVRHILKILRDFYASLPIQKMSAERTLMLFFHLIWLLAKWYLKRKHVRSICGKWPLEHEVITIKRLLSYINYVSAVTHNYQVQIKWVAFNVIIVMTHHTFTNNFCSVKPTCHVKMEHWHWKQKLHFYIKEIDL